MPQMVVASRTGIYSAWFLQLRFEFWPNLGGHAVATEYVNLRWPTILRTEVQERICVRTLAKNPTLLHTLLVSHDPLSRGEIDVILLMEELPPPGTHKILEIMGKTTYQLVSRIFSINVRWFPSCFSLSFVGKPFVPKGDIQILSATQGAAKRLLCVQHKSRETPLLKSDLLTNSWVFWIFLLSKVILSLTTLSISLKWGPKTIISPFFQGAVSALFEDEFPIENCWFSRQLDYFTTG